MKKLTQTLLIGLGMLCVALALLGLFLPVLPTTPFLLLAAFLFARSSERALRWLLNNPWFGAIIRNYRAGRGMTLLNKVITLVSLWLTITLTAVFVVDSLWVRIVLGLVAAGVSTHILRIKTCCPEREGPDAAETLESV